MCDGNTGKCICEPNFVGNPDSICMPPVTIPTCQPACGKNAHCEYGLFENVCICNSGTFGNPYDNCQTEKSRKCTDKSCGANAVCIQGSNIECQCKPGFNGNPYTNCYDINECSTQLCGENAICINTIGSFECKCKEKYFGNPYDMCSPIEMDPKTCNDPKTCKCDAIKSQCPIGYKCERGRCKNLCDKKKCGPHAACNSNSGECSCVQGYTGNPNDLSKGCMATGQCSTDLDCKDTEICFKNGRGFRKCVDGCTKLQCGPNSVCVTTEHKSSCFCIDDNYRGNPYESRGCQIEERTPQLQPQGCDAVACGKNEHCKIGDKGPICYCDDLFVWNPVTSTCEKPSLPQCSSDNECPETDACRPDDLGVLKCQPACAEYNCPKNSVCVAERHVGSCVCLPGYSGHVNDRYGCRNDQHNECSTSAQCSESDMCIKQQGISKCVSACSTIKCGPNAVCITNNHLAQCQCAKSGYIGDPYDGIKGCEKVPCIYNEDCPPTQLCNRMTHQCFDICQPDSCGDNAICVVRETERASLCRCQPGFRANPIPEVGCVPDEQCTASSCHPSAICEVTKHGPVCKCPTSRHVGDPYTKGCILQVDGECSSNDDCPVKGFVCKNRKCINLCEKECGRNALCKINARGRPECSCPGRFIALTGNPKDGCIRSSEKCSSDVDCGNGVCDNNQCRFVCKKTSDCLDGEKCINNLCTLSCIHNSNCNKDQVCINSVCEYGCRNSNNCADKEACINGKCQNPCELNACGPNSQCVVRHHKIQCECPEGFEPNPTEEQGCIRVPTICLDTKQCPKSHECVSGRCAPKCTTDLSCATGERCSNGMCSKICYTSNNCLPGEICINGLCEAGCLSDADCPHLTICRQSKCVCDKGFINTPDGCGDIDECADRPCNSNAICENTLGSYRCLCPDNYIGDPYGSTGCKKSDECQKNSDCPSNLSCKNKKCVDNCALGAKQCSQNAICQVEDHIASKYIISKF